jgi:hypothetical protein
MNLLASCRNDEKKTEPVSQITAEEETAPISSGSENVTGNFIRFIGNAGKRYFQYRSIANG